MAVGKVKNIMLTLKGTPVTPNALSKKYPISGINSSLATEAMTETLRNCLILLNVNAPPMESKARGSVTEVINRKVLTTAVGNEPTLLE